KAHAGRVGVVHISAHAVENLYLPSRSLLMLSDGPSDMGSMAALELSGSLVVLSNCPSRGATARGGEGVSGLLWGPLAAGARAVVVSSWHASHQATADLMGQFHHFRGRGHGDAEALRRARERLAATQNYRHPYYWAAFGLVAAPSAPASAAGALLRWWWLALIAASLYLGFRFLRSRPRPA
ncbi:MAG: CHAT domain-containing protein, partial [Planctomycetota bacterium]